MNKTQVWAGGYLAQLRLDQTWLAGQTTAWNISIAFCQQIDQFKVSLPTRTLLLQRPILQVWSAGISLPPSPAPHNSWTAGLRQEVVAVSLHNLCWNNILYPCQTLQLSFLVRHPDLLAPTQFDIVSLLQSVQYGDGTTDAREFCPPAGKS